MWMDDRQTHDRPKCYFLVVSSHLILEPVDRDDIEFWEQEKSIFLEEFPQHVGLFDGLDTLEDDESGQETAVSES